MRPISFNQRLAALILFPCLVTFPAHADFVVLSPANIEIMRIDNAGNCTILGTLYQTQENISDSSETPEFKVRNANGVIVACVRGDSGDLFLKGEVSELAETQLSTLTSKNFSIRNADQETVAAFDEFGNLYLAGTLIDSAE